jgi:PAS domain S-box-containing protein
MVEIMNFLDSSHSQNPMTGVVSAGGNPFGQAPTSLWLRAVWFSIGYFLCAEASIFLYVPGSPFIAIWLPTGLYVAVLLLNRTRDWPWLVLAVLPANLVFDFWHGTKLTSILVFYCTNTVEAVVGAWLVRRFVAERPTLASLKEFLGLMGFSAVFSTMLGATISAGMLTALGASHSFAQSWMNWWTGEAMAILLLTSFILTWFSGPEKNHPPLPGARKNMLEICLLVLLSLALTGHLLFMGQGVMSPNKGPVLIPLLWAALRFGPRGAAAANLLLALPVAFFTTQFSLGLTPAQASSGEYVPIMQIALALVSMAALIPAIVLHSHDRIMVQLHESEERFRNLTAAAFEGIFITENGRIVDMNDQGLKMFGYERSEMIGREPGEFVSPETRAIVMEAIRTNRESRYEHQLIRKDGTPFHAEAQAKMVRVGDRNLRMTALRDITERKRAEESLIQSEERFSLIFKNSPMPIALVRLADGVILDVNESFSGMSGYTRDEVVGHTALELKIYPDPSKRAIIMDELRRHGHLHGHEQLFRTKSGQIRDHELWLDVICIRGEQCMLVIALDITERKRAEEESLWKTAFLEAQVDSALDGIMVVNSEGKKILQNKRMNELWKFPPHIAADPSAAAQLQYAASRTRNPGEFVKRVAHLYAHPDQVGRDEIELIDGTILDRYSSPVRDAAGKHYGRIWTFREITQQKKLEAEFRQMQKMEAVGQLAGGVAHDFNNILAVIKVQSDLLKAGGGLSPAQLELAEGVSEAAERGAGLTRQLLMFGRKETLRLRDLDLDESINGVSTMLRRTLGENIELQFTFARQPLFIHADAGMMGQILMNLAVNARDAMPKGGRLAIETSAVEFDEAAAAQTAPGRRGAFVCLSVSDTGCGIPPDNLPRIFEPFFTTKDVGKGTGLGLATVFGIVQQHQGWINVYSEVGQGTTFCIYLPRLVRFSREEPEKSKLASVRGGNETILLVEDDAFLRAAVSKTLSQLGYHVLEAISGIEALEVWKKNRAGIHLLVTDLVMPGGINGKDLAERLLKENPRLNVIYASGYSAEIAGKDFPLEEGVNFFSKPFETEKLAQTIRNRLDGVLTPKT